MEEEDTGISRLFETVASASDEPENRFEIPKSLRAFFFIFPGVLSSSEGNAKKRVKYDFLQFCIYLVFVGLTIDMVLSDIPARFWLTNMVEDEYVVEEFESSHGTERSFYSINHPKDFWEFLKSLFFSSDYWFSWYENEAAFLKGRFMSNKLLGTVRLHQLRVNSYPCEISKIFPQFANCYPGYSEENKNTSTFGHKNSTAWKYTEGDESALRGSYTGIMTTYDDLGYYIDISPNSLKTRRLLRELKHGLWITRHTRVVLLDFTIYNANINLFCIVKVSFEFPETGGILTQAKFLTVRLIPSPTDESDSNILHYLFTLLLVHFTIEETLELFFMRLRYFTKFWNYVEWAVIIIAFKYNTLCREVVTVSDTILEEINNSPKTFVYFYYVGYLKTLTLNLSGFLLLIVMLKILKFSKMSRNLGQLNDSLHKNINATFGFLTIFGIFFFVYAMLGNLLFGRYIKNFSSLRYSILTLLKSIMGGFEYEEIRHEAWAAFFYVTFVFILFFLLLNMFIAIICDAYIAVQKEVPDDRRQMRVEKFLAAPFKVLFGIKASSPVKGIRGGDNKKCLEVFFHKCGYSNAEVYFFLQTKKIQIKVEDLAHFLQGVLRVESSLRDTILYVRHKLRKDPLVTKSSFDKLKADINTLQQDVEKFHKLVDRMQDF